jgi:hypothetical protein
MAGQREDLPYQNTINWTNVRRKVKLSLRQAVKACRVIRHRGSPTFSRQSAHRWGVKLSALRAGRALHSQFPGTHFCWRLSHPQDHSNPSSRTAALGLTQPLTYSYMSTRKLLGVYGRQLRRHLWADYLHNVGSSTSHNPTGLHGLLHGWLYFFHF